MRVDVVAGCRTRQSVHAEYVERVEPREHPSFWGHYLVEPDGRQIWQADYVSLEAALVAARHSGAHRVYVDEGGRLTPR